MHGKGLLVNEGTVFVDAHTGQAWWPTAIVWSFGTITCMTNQKNTRLLGFLAIKLRTAAKQDLSVFVLLPPQPKNRIKRQCSARS